jgi:hypothetical protein
MAMKNSKRLVCSLSLGCAIAFTSAFVEQNTPLCSSANTFNRPLFTTLNYTFKVQLLHLVNFNLICQLPPHFANSGHFAGAFSGPRLWVHQAGLQIVTFGEWLLDKGNAPY